MSILGRFWRLGLLRGSGRREARGDPPDEVTPELQAVVALLSAQFQPRAAFVLALEERLKSAGAVAAPKRKPARLLLMPAWAMVALTTLLVLVGAAIGVYRLFSIGPLVTPVRADAIAEAYNRLLSSKSVRYQVEGEMNVGVCSVVLDVPLTEEEQVRLTDDPRALKGTGIVLSCQSSPVRYSEESVYDLDRKASHTRIQLPTLPLGPGQPAGERARQVRERIYVEGTLYLREGDGAWRVQTAAAPWSPFVVEDGRPLPLASLSALAQKYDTVEALPDTELDGVPVRHYRATRTDAYHGTTEVTDVWVGTADERPRKAVVQTRQAFSLEEYVGPVLQNIQRGFEDPANPYYKYRDLPVVTRGEIPSEKVVTWTYIFGQFDQPVEIVPPLVEQ